MLFSQVSVCIVPWRREVTNLHIFPVPVHEPLLPYISKPFKCIALVPLCHWHCCIAIQEYLPGGSYGSSAKPGQYVELSRRRRNFTTRCVFRLGTCQAAHPELVCFRTKSILFQRGQSINTRSSYHPGNRVDVQKTCSEFTEIFECPGFHNSYFPFRYQRRIWEN